MKLVKFKMNHGNFKKGDEVWVGNFLYSRIANKVDLLASGNPKKFHKEAEKALKSSEEKPKTSKKK